ncbi:uncharacterized protein HMPREF1541_01132 [Cyphellophora europaea CBS 101466]|uniref:Cryptic loci regulator 2 N-terminal domain-containing protein n=1 Tax=Cyphellophora europaea (strain CBS 101466) TaxID=1220924 RepID=W2SG22_CYPE1|nr:uncharacterized protein HMPREF1541_01132 [Cyphellophora europaea CBS 101466]ETN46943.1 hypothetical protein HMPREF1541_01132 [Cyphellophora europaea CBS 101466]
MAFQRKKIGVQGRWIGLQIRDISDGEQRKWPECPPYRPADDENYLIQLGQVWEEHGKPGVNYYIERLPDGYGVFEVDQPAGAQTYKRLFGHPNGRYYDSIPKFTPHFLWLMGGMEGDCRCHLCRKHQCPLVPRQSRKPRDVVDFSLLTRPKRDGPTTGDDSSDHSSAAGIASRRPRRDVRQTGAPYAVDEEGTDDVFKLFIKRLELAKDSNRGIDQDIEETSSLDWRAEHNEEGHDLMRSHLTQIEHQPAFLPRIGETVLWCTNLLDGQRLAPDKVSSEYKLYSAEQDRWYGFPAWRAGVITATPSADVQNRPLGFQDLLVPQKTTTALNIAGYRVETLPSPNNALDKPISKQYKWVPLSSIRPLSQWQFLLHGIPDQKLHPSIMAALTCSTSLSLVEKFKATGLWPNGAIHCKGIYLGSELITVGDTIRLTSPRSTDICEDVLTVESIRLHLGNIQPEHTLRDSPFLAKTSWVSFVGKAWTQNVSNAFKGPGPSSTVSPLSLAEMQIVFRSVGASEYGPWYHLHNPTKKYEVSYEQVLGRLCEAAAVQVWVGNNLESDTTQANKPALDFDIKGILAARAYASHADERLPETQGNEILWFWADTRAEGLAVESFNGMEVGQYWPVRETETLEQWHGLMRVLNGVNVTTAEVPNYVAVQTSTRGRKPGTKVVNGKLVYPGDPEYDSAIGGQVKPKPSSQMAGAAFASTDEESDEDDGAGDISNWAAQPSKWQVAEGQDGIEIYHPEMAESQELSPERPTALAAQPAIPEHVSKAPMSKTQIMAAAVRQSIEGDDLAENMSEEDWYDAPMPLARGGTEESSGGDYDPKQQPRGRGRRYGDASS